MAVTSYGRNKNDDDEIKKKTKRRSIIAPAIAVRLLNKPITWETLSFSSLFYVTVTDTYSDCKIYGLQLASVNKPADDTAGILTNFYFK